MPDLEDIKDITDSGLDNFLDTLTPDQEAPFNEFTIRQLAIWPGQNSWRPYRWKT